MHSSDSGSQSKPPSKRASRAGTRSVSTLSSAQLDRKRANDREAQRAIRQRTKDHIESLERRISELTSAHEAREKLFLATQQRNQELEDEVAYLRARLPGDAFTSMNVNQTEGKHDPKGIHKESLY
jgi:tRNA U34 5-carboxymethylaminomethyl modifying GTPase MnmE/TrmE